MHARDDRSNEPDPAVLQAILARPEIQRVLGKAAQGRQILPKESVLLEVVDYITRNPSCFDGGVSPMEFFDCACGKTPVFDYVGYIVRQLQEMRLVRVSIRGYGYTLHPPRKIGGD